MVDSSNFFFSHQFLSLFHNFLFSFRDRSRADPEELTIAIAKAKADAILPKIKVESFFFLH